MNSNMIPLKDLNLTSRFLFDAVMEDPQTHQDVLSIILGREIPLLEKSESEKELRVSPLIRTIRMDVFSMDEEKVIYNTEMQQKRKNDLRRRSRFYQAMVDTSLLEPGVPDYNKLNQTYLIMITPFDLFGFGKYRYTFEAQCIEKAGYTLQDGAVRIFLNTRGSNDEEVSAELAAFLHYVENTTGEEASKTDSERVRRIHERVCKVKSSEEMGVKYMQAWEERYYDKQDARREGLAEGLAEGRTQGRIEGRAQGEHSKLRSIVAHMSRKGSTVEEIAEILGENRDTIFELAEEIRKEKEE
ncbi:MAG: Rpn family recombination-promoting nuclease/putative transposase [Clostridiales bacterium]|nr:Rpn family recombination-promoting nuclease/putative transposase [Clostridiales bacterium]